jgi:hypothetical protein
MTSSVRPEIRRPQPSLVVEAAAVWLLPLGSLFVGVGWLIGVILLWASNVWTRGEKWLGTLVVPGGLAAPVIMLLGYPVGPCGVTTTTGSDGSFTTTTSGCAGSALPLWLAYPLLAGLVVAPIAVAVFLWTRARKRVRQAA